MKASRLALALALALWQCVSAASQELPERIKEGLKDREPRWRLLSQESNPRSLMCSWSSNGKRISAHLDFTRSEEEAVRTLESRWSTTPENTPKPAEFGPEARLSKYPTDDYGNVMLRKFNVVIYAYGYGWEALKRITKNIADLVNNEQAQTHEIEATIKETLSGDHEYQLERCSTSAESYRFTWTSGKKRAEASVSVEDSREAAAQAIKRYLLTFSILPKVERIEIGDEALLFTDVVLFRKSNLTVFVRGSSQGVAKRFARHVADTLSAN